MYCVLHLPLSSAISDTEDVLVMRCALGGCLHKHTLFGYSNMYFMLSIISTLEFFTTFQRKWWDGGIQEAHCITNRKRINKWMFQFKVFFISTIFFSQEWSGTWATLSSHFSNNCLMALWNWGAIRANTWTIAAIKKSH